MFQLTGCALLSIGVWLRVSYEGYATLLPQYALLSADIVAIIIGALTIVLSFFACCGSWLQSRCLLITVSSRKQTHTLFISTRNHMQSANRVGQFEGQVAF